MSLLAYSVIVLSTTLTLGAQMLLKHAVSNEQARAALSNGIPAFLLNAAMNPLVWLAFAMQAIAYIAWLFVLTRGKIAVVFALQGAFAYLLIALCGWFFFSEKLSAYQWLGMLLISGGVFLVAFRTPSI